MARRDIVVIGGSAGAIEALIRLAQELPRDTPACFLVVLHFPEGHRTTLPQILTHAGGMPGVLAEDGAALTPGRFHVANPGSHLLVERDRMRLIRGPRENRHRPSIDVLFRSAAAAFGPRAVGLILSGTMEDGKAGLEAVERAGGVTMVQSPEDSLFPELPANILRVVPTQHVMPIPGLARTLTGLLGEECPDGPYPKDELAREVHMIDRSGNDPDRMDEVGDLTMLKCPDCRGALWEIRHTALLRYRCHLGHAFSADSLGAGTEADTEKALWQAVELLKEQSHLFQGMAAQAREGDPIMVERFETKARNSQSHAEALEKLVGSYLSQ